MSLLHIELLGGTVTAVRVSAIIEIRPIRPGGFEDLSTDGPVASHVYLSDGRILESTEPQDALLSQMLEELSEAQASADAVRYRAAALAGMLSGVETPGARYPDAETLVKRADEYAEAMLL